MNKEIYLMDMRAKPTQRGYQKWLKVLWDEDYPHIKQYDSKTLSRTSKEHQEKEFK